MKVLLIEHETGCPPALFEDGLRALGVPVETVRPYLGDPVPTTTDEVAGLAGLVVLGGEMAAWEDEAAPWLPAVRSLLGHAVSRQVPTLGICLGAQLLALACGGRVGRGAAGLEVGLTAVRVLPRQDAFFGDVRDRLGGDEWQVRHFHGDAVTALPPGAELLVTGNVYPNQGFRVGQNAWGVQYHPEVSDAGFAAWAAKGEADGVLPSAEKVMEPLRATADGQAQVAMAHAAAFAARLT